MKVIITFYTQTGNTEMLADSAYKELSQDSEVTIKNIEDTSASDLSGCDVVIISSPIHGGGLAAPVQQFLASLPTAPGYKLAALITHLSAVYQTAQFERGLSTLVETCDQKDIDYLGYYDCQGKLAAKIRPIVQKGQGMSDDEFKHFIDELDKHPTPEEVAGAATFARELVAKA
jgi:flavodoxin